MPIFCPSIYLWDQKSHALFAPPPLHPRRNNRPTIQRNRRPINIRTGPRAQEQASAGNILRTANPPQRNTRLNRLTKLPQRRRHHLALKGSARYRVGRDVSAAKMMG